MPNTELETGDAKMRAEEERIVLAAHNAGFQLTDDFLCGLAFWTVCQSEDDIRAAMAANSSPNTLKQVMAAVTGEGFIHMKAAAIRLGLPVELGGTAHAHTEFTPNRRVN